MGSAWWALLGSLIGVLRVATFGYWSQSYWSGAVGMLGGCLVLWALRRIVRQPHARDGILLGTGLGILALSRPYEGFLLNVPVAVALLLWLIGDTAPSWRVALARVVLPTLVVLGTTGAAVALYNCRFTGHPLRMPYQVHEMAYAVAPLFVWQHLRPAPVYRHDVMREFHTTPVRGRSARPRSSNNVP